MQRGYFQNENIMKPNVSGYNFNVGNQIQANKFIAPRPTKMNLFDKAKAKAGKAWDGFKDSFSNFSKTDCISMDEVYDPDVLGEAG